MAGTCDVSRADWLDATLFWKHFVHCSEGSSALAYAVDAPTRHRLEPR